MIFDDASDFQTLHTPEAARIRLLDGKPHDNCPSASELCQLAMGLSRWTGQQLFRALQEHFRWLGTVCRSCWCCSGATGDLQELLRLEEEAAWKSC